MYENPYYRKKKPSNKFSYFDIIRTQIESNSKLKLLVLKNIKQCTRSRERRFNTSHIAPRDEKIKKMYKLNCSHLKYQHQISPNQSWKKNFNDTYFNKCLGFTYNKT